MPRRKLPIRFGLCPWYELGSFGPRLVGPSPNQGLSPKATASVTARHSRRLTSGGEADTNSCSLVGVLGG